MKSEAESYGIDHLAKEKKTVWSGVRNYQARNFMRAMKVGDQVLFYHSNSKPTGIVGLAKVVTKAHPDVTQFDPKGNYFEPRATKDKPIWECVDVGFVKKFKVPLTLDQIKFDPRLAGMRVREPGGSRLSVQPVSEKHFRYIVEKMGK